MFTERKKETVKTVFLKKYFNVTVESCDSVVDLSFSEGLEAEEFFNCIIEESKASRFICVTYGDKYRKIDTEGGEFFVSLSCQHRESIPPDADQYYEVSGKDLT